MHVGVCMHLHAADFLWKKSRAYVSNANFVNINVEVLQHSKQFFLRILSMYVLVWVSDLVSVRLQMFVLASVGVRVLFLIGTVALYMVCSTSLG